LFGYGTSTLQTQATPTSRETTQITNFETKNNNLEIPNVRNYFSEPMTSSVEIKPRNCSNSSIHTIECINTRKSHQPGSNFMHVPCINCNNLVHIDEIGKRKFKKLKNKYNF
jgi:hypothetical protein